MHGQSTESSGVFFHSGQFLCFWPFRSASLLTLPSPLGKRKERVLSRLSMFLVFLIRRFFRQLPLLAFLPLPFPEELFCLSRKSQRGP